MPASRRRRKGYTFEATNRRGERGRVRATIDGTPTDARLMLDKRGYTDIVYIPADVLRAESKPADGGWALNAQDFRELLTREGITWPVEFHYNGRAVTVEGSAGNHKAREDGKGGFFHRIMVKSFLTSTDAETTVRHEVRHAKQAERVFERTGALGFKTAWRKACRDGVTYAHKPLEQDARRAERENTDLTLTRKSRPQTGQRRFAGR